MASERLPNDVYPEWIGPYPNRGLRCIWCGCPEGEPHALFLGRKCEIDDGKPYASGFRLAFEYGFKKAMERESRFIDAFLKD